MSQSATEAPSPPSPVRERGYAHPGGSTGFWGGLIDDSETTPELQWPNSVAVYERMPTQDAQVSSVLRAVTLPILRTQWRVDGTGCRPEVTQHVATDLGLPIVGEGNDVRPVRGRGRFSWNRHLAEALTYLQYGHHVAEQVYRLDERTGLLHLRKLGPRWQQTIAGWNVARDGGLVSVQQYAPGGILGAGTITLPVHRLVVYVHDPRRGNWTGRSLLRPAYKNWILKDDALRNLRTLGDRNGVGQYVYEDAENGTPETLERGEEIAQGMRSGEYAGAAVPHGASVRAYGVQGELPDILAEIRYHDEQMGRAVLAHFLNLDAKGGSYALASVQADTFVQSLQAVAEDIRDTATAHVVEDLVDVNWGPDEPAPRLVFDEIGSRREAVMAAIKVLRDAGVLTSDEDLEDFVRTTLGLPPRSGSSNPEAS